MKKPPQHSLKGLRHIAAEHGLLFGAAVTTGDLGEESFRTALLRDCSLLSAEYEMKWDAVVGATPGWDYGLADELVRFAQDHGLAVHGHTLWWHGSVPKAFATAQGRQFADAALHHLSVTAGRYAGQVYSWDVVNEPLDLNDGRADVLRASPFLDALGPGYIGTAFREASAADSGAILVLNEMGLEYASSDAERKRRAMLALLERELVSGSPIHCLGLQSHLDAGHQPRDNPGLWSFLREVAALGLSVMITEMDVSDWRCPRAHRDKIVAETYKAHIELVLEACPTLAVTTWGLSDARTWLAECRPQADGATLRPLPLDRRLRRKRAWHAIAEALAAAPDRGGKAAL